MKTESTEQMKEIKQWVNDALHKVSEQVSQLGAHIKNYSAKGVEITSETISEHPLKSTGIALACGFLIGYLIGRK